LKNDVLQQLINSSQKSQHICQVHRAQSVVYGVAFLALNAK